MSTSRVRAAACVAFVLGLVPFNRKTMDGHAFPVASSKVAEAATQLPNECITQFDFLVPFQRYNDADLVRAMAVDGDQVYFRTYTEVFRVPRAGGTPTRMTTMPRVLMSSRMWSAGDRFVAQSPGEPIFMALPKTGGIWSTLLDASKETPGGRRSQPHSRLRDSATESRGKAEAAVFDGSFFYWIQQTHEPGRSGSWVVRKLALAGGAPATLYESASALSGLEEAGGRLVFFQRKRRAARKASAKPKKRHGVGLKTPPALMSLTLDGGKADMLVPKIDGNILLADGSTLYVSRLDEGDATHQGVFRIDISGNSGLTPTGLPLVIGGGGVLYGEDKIALWGISTLKQGLPGQIPETGRVILTAHRGGSFERTACIGPGYTTHAYVVTDKTLLVSIFREEDRSAGIVRIKLP